MSVAVDSEQGLGNTLHWTAATSGNLNFTNTAGTYLVVGAEGNGISGGESPNTNNFTGVTYNSVGMTAQSPATLEGWFTHATSWTCQTVFYTLASPATGTNALAWTATKSTLVFLGATSCTNVGGIGTSGVNFTETASTTSPTISLSGVAAGSMVFTIYGQGSQIFNSNTDQSNITYSAGQVLSNGKNVGGSTAGDNFAMTRTSNTGSLSLNIAGAALSDIWGMSAIELTASGGATAPLFLATNPLTGLGVGGPFFESPLG